MARTSSTEVGKVIELDTAITDLTPFIESAHELVEELCNPTGSTLTEARLTLIETWLAAHFYATRDQQFSSRNAGSAGGSYQGQTTMMLSSTFYGQQAMLMDTTGALAIWSDQVSKGKKPTVGITWLGTDLEESEVSDE